MLVLVLVIVIVLVLVLSLSVLDPILVLESAVLVLSTSLNSLLTVVLFWVSGVPSTATTSLRIG